MKIKMASQERDETYFDPENLPVLVAENIASHLSGLDLINLGMTCKFWHEIAASNAVWKMLCEKRFGKQPGETGSENFKKVYFKLGRMKLSVVDFDDILHFGNRYLKKINDPESSSGSVLHLKTVCWLQVDGKFKAVFAGEYNVLWRMKLNNAYMRCSEEACIYYKATPKLGCGVELWCKWDEDKLRKEEKDNGTNTWFVYNSGVLTVETMCDVHVEIHGRNDYWCGGFYWDYVQLKCVNDSSTSNFVNEQSAIKPKGKIRPGSCDVM